MERPFARNSPGMYTHPKHTDWASEPWLGSRRPPKPVAPAPLRALPPEHASAILAATPVSSHPTPCDDLLETSSPPSGTYSRSLIDVAFLCQKIPAVADAITTSATPNTVA